MKIHLRSYMYEMRSYNDFRSYMYITFIAKLLSSYNFFKHLNKGKLNKSTVYM